MSALAAILLAAPLVVGPSAPGDIAVDAFFQEWDGRPVALVDRTVKGTHGGPKDLSARLQIAFDADHLYLAVQAVDDVFQPGAATTGDRLEIVFAPEGKAPRRLRVLLNQLELGIAPALELDGKPYRHGKVIGTTRRDGWAIEAQVRLKDLPGVVGPDVPIVALIDDADADSVRIEATVSNGPVDAERRPTLATFRLDPTGDAERLYLSDRGSPTVLARHQGQLTGDPLNEALLITNEDIVVLGRLPGNAAYLYFTHGWRTGAEVLRSDLMELDGRPGKELFVEHREWAVPGEVQVDVVEVFGVRDGVLRRMFAAKTAERFVKRGGAAVAKFRVLKGKGARRFKVEAATLEGEINEGSYYVVDPPGVVPHEPLPVPWEEKGGVVYRLQGEAWLR